MKTLPIVDILRLALDDSAEPEYDVCDVSIHRSVPIEFSVTFRVNLLARSVLRARVGCRLFEIRE